MSADECNLINFLVYENNELDILTNEHWNLISTNDIVSWLKPYVTYEELKKTSGKIDAINDYTEALENLVDRLYLVLNIIIIKLEGATKTFSQAVRKPIRLTFGSLCRVIIDNISHFVEISSNDKKKPVIEKQFPSMIEENSSNDSCDACIKLFNRLNHITHTIDSIDWHCIKSKRNEVKDKIDVLTNAQTMESLCEAIECDLNNFVTNYKKVKLKHEIVQKENLKYKQAITDLSLKIADCESTFMQHQMDYEVLNNKMDLMREAFAGKLRHLEARYASVLSASLLQLENSIGTMHRHNNVQQMHIGTLTCTLQITIQHLEMCIAFVAAALQKIIGAIDICVERMLMLQQLLRKLQIAYELRSKHAADDDGHNCVDLAKNPIQDMLMQIERNRKQIGELQKENERMQSTVDRIKALRI